MSSVVATLGEMLNAVSQQHHDEMAFWEEGNHYSYGQLLDLAQHAGGAQTINPFEQ
jgi:hypothetical protein